MAKRPIVSIDVDDEKFKRFLELFNDYQTKLDGMPESWKKLDAVINGSGKTVVKVVKELDKVSDATEAVGDHLDNAADSIKVVDKELGKVRDTTEEIVGSTGRVVDGIDDASDSAEALRKKSHEAALAIAIGATTAATITEAIEAATKAQHQFHSATRSAGGAMVSLERSAGRVAHSIFGIGKWLLKFGAMGAGLGALGGGFGIDELASSAMSRQKGARGLGLTPGQLASYQANMAPYGGMGALEGAARAQVSPQDAGWLATLGISQGKAAGESAATLALQELSAVRRAWRADPSTANASIQAGQHLGIDLATARTVAAPSSATWNAAKAATARDAGALGFSVKTAREWTALSVELHKAGILIETGFIRGLAPLAPVFDRIAAAASGAIGAFLESKEVKKGLTEFAAFLQSPALISDLKEFGAAIEIAAHNVKLAAEAFGLIPGAKSAANPTPHALRSLTTGPLRLPGFAGPLKEAAQVRVASAEMDRKYGFPSGTMGALAGAESSGRNLAAFHGHPSSGVWQMMPDTARAFGVQHRQNIGQEARGAAAYLDRLHRRFGSLSKAIGAYNMGPNALAADIKAHGAHWLAHAPHETRGEILHMAGFLPKGAMRDHLMAAFETSQADILEGKAAELARRRAGLPDSGPGSIARWQLSRQIAEDNSGAAAARASAAHYNGDIAHLARAIVKPLGKAIRVGVKPAHVMITNQTSARVAVSVNAVSH